jgi:hypothetical protein
MNATSHTGIGIIKDVSSNLIDHARSWLLWRRWRRCIKGVTLLSKVSTKLSQTPFEWYLHREQMGEMDQSSHILHIFAQTEWGGVSLSVVRTGRRRGLVWVDGFLYFIHVLLKLHLEFSFLIKPCFHGMVRATHAKK